MKGPKHPIVITWNKFCFQFLTVVVKETSVLYDTTPCCLVDTWHFGRTSFISVLGKRLKRFWQHGVRNSSFFKSVNMNNSVPKCKVSHVNRRWYCCHFWEQVFSSALLLIALKLWLSPRHDGPRFCSVRNYWWSHFIWSYAQRWRSNRRLNIYWIEW